MAWLAGFTLIDSSIVSRALPDIAADFGRTVGELAWVTTGFLLALAATLLPAGRLSDRFGMRRVLLLGAGTSAGGRVIEAVGPPERPTVARLWGVSPSRTERP